MSFKTNFTELEMINLTDQEIRKGLIWLRKYRSYTQVPEPDATKMFEEYLSGDSLSRIASKYTQYPEGQIYMTAAVRKWGNERELLVKSMQSKVRTQVIKSITDQVDFLSTMMDVTRVQHMEDMRKFIEDPVNNPKPNFNIKSIKDYQTISDTLLKIIQTITVMNEKKNPEVSKIVPNSVNRLAGNNTQTKKLTILDAADGEED